MAFMNLSAQTWAIKNPLLPVLEVFRPKPINNNPDLAPSPRLSLEMKERIARVRDMQWALRQAIIGEGHLNDQDLTPLVSLSTDIGLMLDDIASDLKAG